MGWTLHKFMRDAHDVFGERSRGPGEGFRIADARGGFLRQVMGPQSLAISLEAQVAFSNKAPRQQIFNSQACCDYTVLPHTLSHVIPMCQFCLIIAVTTSMGYIASYRHP